MLLKGELNSIDDIPGASVSALYKKFLVLGSPVDFDGILVCTKQ